MTSLKKNTLFIAIFFVLSLFAGTGTSFAGQTLSVLKNKPVASNFKLEDQDGKMVQLTDFRGKVVIINFWASWCPPCRKEMPSMQRAWEILSKEGIMMLGINVGEDSDAIFAFTAEYPVEFPLLMDKTSGVFEKWGARGLPMTYILDPDGKINYQAIGERERDAPETLEKIKALKKK